MCSENRCRKISPCMEMLHHPFHVAQDCKIHSGHLRVKRHRLFGRRRNLPKWIRHDALHCIGHVRCSCGWLTSYDSVWRSGACEPVKRRYSHTELAALIQQLHLDLHPAAPTTHHDHRLVFNFVSRSACLRTIFGPVVSQHVLSEASSRTDAATLDRSGCPLSLATARQLHLASGGVWLCHSE